MCGFTGIAWDDPKRAPERALLSRMARTLEHRGPDDEGIEVRAPFGMGFRRLSIIDLAGGHQPIFDESGDIAVVCNGEIYNFEELRKGLEARGHRFRTGSDVECVVHLYEEHGERLAEHLTGMFAFAVFDWRDPARPKLLLGRDRIGIKPLYFARTSEGLLFASEVKAILESGLVSRQLRATAMLDYLVQGYTSGLHSAWEGIDRVPPASTLSFVCGEEPRVARYWDLPVDGLREPARDDEILEWLDRVVRDHLVSDVPLGAFLSGGIDSNAVADSMARLRSGAATGRAERSVRDALVLCSVGFREAEFDELDVARESAKALGAVHHTQVLEPDPKLALDVLPWFFDEPLADPSTVPTYLVSRMAREHVTVALTGDGGDEVFGGYRRYVFDVAENRVRARLGRGGQRLLAMAGRVYPKLDWAPRVLRAKHTLLNFGADPARAYFQSLTQLPREAALAVLQPELARSLAGHDPFIAFAEHYHRPRGVDALYRAQYADFHTFLPDQILVKSDRASMGASLEVRPPLLDHRFVERFANLPTPEKVRGGRGKHAFREALRGRVRGDVLDGPKRGFDIPLRRWLAGPLSGVVRDALHTLPADWFDRAALVAKLEEHQGGGRDHSHLLWSLLVLERWRQRHRVSDTLA
ncbi:MAG: asparagine synthase (glutamine-hydrolyzing) [Planctomycetes bacterium]|nr:asparagine synthase (glutamine-hydrolyzing) [Planctomycetota bacterium]